MCLKVSCGVAVLRWVACVCVLTDPLQCGCAGVGGGGRRGALLALGGCPLPAAAAQTEGSPVEGGQGVRRGLRQHASGNDEMCVCVRYLQESIAVSIDMHTN